MQHAPVQLQLSQTLPECEDPPGEEGHHLRTDLPGVKHLQFALHQGQETEHRLTAKGVAGDHHMPGGEPEHPVLDGAANAGPGTPGVTGMREDLAPGSRTLGGLTPLLSQENKSHDPRTNQPGPLIFYHTQCEKDIFLPSQS